MSQQSQYWALVLPERGEFSGTWDVPLNANFTTIDIILSQLHKNRASITAPTTSLDEGSSWFDSATGLLKISRSSTFIPVVAHTHDGSIEGVGKINLATHTLLDINYKLPGYMIDSAGFDADTLDGYHLLELAQQLSGAGLGFSAGKLTLGPIGVAGTYTKVIADAYGRVTSGTNPTTIAGFGITDVYTKNEILTNFASINGISTKLFRINSPVDGVSNPGALVLSECAVPRSFVEAYYSPIGHSHGSDFAGADHTHSENALLNGDNTENFNVAAPVDDTAAYDDNAIPRVYADTRYKTPLDTHVGIPHIYADGTIQMTDDLILDRITAPTDDYAATSKAFVLNEISNLEQAKADLGGDTTQAFKVAKAPGSVADPVDYNKYALSIERADEIYSKSQHIHSEYIDINDINNIANDIEAAVLESFEVPSGFQQITKTQSILSASVDANGDANFLSFSGQNIDILGLTTPLRYVISDGFNSIGERFIYQKISTDIPSAFTIPTVDEIYKLIIAKNTYNLSFDASDEALNADEVVLSENGSGILLSDLPEYAYMKFSGDETVYLGQNKQIAFSASGAVQGESNIALDDTGLTATLADNLPEDGFIKFDGDFTVYSYNVPDPIGFPGDIVITPSLQVEVLPATGYIFSDQYGSAKLLETGRMIISPTLAQATVSAAASLYSDAAGTIAVAINKTEYESITDTITYSTKEPTTPSTNELWFDIANSICKKYNGASWITRPFIEIGEAVVIGSVIDSVVSYPVGTMIPEKTTVDTVIGPKFKITSDGGYAVRITNKTGAASVKGSLVSADTAVDDAFILATGGNKDCFAVVYESGVADGDECWVVVAGISEVLLKDTTASTRGNWVTISDVAGRADATAATSPTGGQLTDHEAHFGQIGHCIQSQTAGTDVLARCVIHFN